MSMPRRTLLPLLLAMALWPLGACESKDERARCARCGMYVDQAKGFQARAGTRRYDTPKCLWADIVEGQAERTQAEVTEYYGQKPMAAMEAHYVVGSDILGPMGADLVPLSPEDADRFAEEHGGRVVEPSAIDAALLESL